MLVPISSRHPLPYMPFFDEVHNHATELCGLFKEYIIDHLENLAFVGSNHKGRDIESFVEEHLRHCEDNVELIKFQTEPIEIRDIYILLSDGAWMNDQIINAVNFMTNVSLYHISKSASKNTLSPLSTHILLHTFAFNEVTICHASDPCNKYVKMLQDPVHYAEGLKQSKWTKTQFENQCQLWYGTQAFGQLARVLGHYLHNKVTPTHITCVFNRNENHHWVVYHIDIHENRIYEYDPMSLSLKGRYHAITPWLAKLLGLFKYQSSQYGPLYFGADDMHLTTPTDLTTRAIKRNMKQEMLAAFDFVSVRATVESIDARKVPSSSTVTQKRATVTHSRGW
eukprot:scaffold23329_cov66-Attheya_sp.AAC.2